MRDYVATLPTAYQELNTWDPARPVPWYRGITAFLFGRDWITASFWQDWYGIRPLLVGSILVSAVALVFAIPFGVAAAIYVSEIASRERETSDQTLHRIYFCHPLGRAWFFRHRRGRRSDSATCRNRIG